MTPLASILAARIKATGPMTLADYMATCLLHPDYGYYATRDPFGAAGDFTTSPEISQMFGEVIGLCLAQSWLDQGRPSPFMLVEIGPGRGTLMADILRVVQGVTGMCDAAQVHLVEVSATLRTRQAQTLEGYDVSWHDSIENLPEMPMYLIANEFFDALPIRQFQRVEGGWSERQVGYRDFKLGFGLARPTRYGDLEHRLSDTPVGQIVETCPILPVIAANIATRIGRDGGVALIIDYGGWRSRGDTFQAVMAHRPVDPFAKPGDADLTAHVDFEALSCAFMTTGTLASAMSTQGVFLERLGITARAKALARNLEGAALELHVSAHRRLTHSEEMGELFKVIACHPAMCAPPPGLDLA